MRAVSISAWAPAPCSFISSSEAHFPLFGKGSWVVHAPWWFSVSYYCCTYASKTLKLARLVQTIFKYSAATSRKSPHLKVVSCKCSNPILRQLRQTKLFTLKCKYQIFTCLGGLKTHLPVPFSVESHIRWRCTFLGSRSVTREVQ
jgi:hypothetical protein